MAMPERERRERAIRSFGALVQHPYKTPKPGSANLPCKECGLGVEAPEHKMPKTKATDLEPIPVEDGEEAACARCNGSGRNGANPCEKCNGSGWANPKKQGKPFTDAKDSAKRQRLHRALDAVMDSVK